jgi:hypothetical protein
VRDWAEDAAGNRNNGSGRIATSGWVPAGPARSPEMTGEPEIAPIS